MKTTIQIFENAEFGKVRTMSDAQGEPLFCGKDVAVALGYSNSREALRKHVEKDDVTKRDTIDALGRVQCTTFINECYIDHRKGYIHIAYNPDRYSMWPFISNQ